MNLTQKQKDKHKRQGYINLLEQAVKSLFKMFRKQITTQEQFLQKINQFIKKIDKVSSIGVSSEYHKKLENYITHLYKQTQQHKFILDEQRESNMTKLNRLQKFKNSTSYKKEKHKKIYTHQD
jgi:L-lactate utilization protein LutC